MENKRINKLMDDVYQLLNSEKVTLEEGYILGQELILSTIEGYAEMNNIHPEEAKSLLIKQIYGIQPEAKPEVNPIQKIKIPVIGMNIGWIGNPNTQLENN
jgi:hypothetical protein